MNVNSHNPLFCQSLCNTRNTKLGIPDTAFSSTPLLLYYYSTSTINNTVWLKYTASFWSSAPLEDYASNYVPLYLLSWLTNIKKYPIFILKTITEQAYNSMQNKMSLFKNILLHCINVYTVCVWFMI